MSHALRRLGFYGVAALAAGTLNFFLPRLMPGDAASALVARFQGRLGPEALGALRRAFGVGEGPLWSQYGAYVRGLLTGDLGVSISQFPTPVSSLVWQGIGWTLLVAGSALVLSFTLGTALGTWAGWHRGGRVDRWVLPGLAAVGAFPYFWLAMGALYLFGFELRWFPLRHAYTDGALPGPRWEFVQDVVRHAALPVLTLVFAGVGGWATGMRANMAAALGSESLGLARLKGLSTTGLAVHYAARNALLPSLTGFGMALGFSLGGAMLTEVVFSYPGLGFLLVQAVRAQDYPLMQGLFLVVTLSVLAGNWAVDVATSRLDPRTRQGDDSP